MKESKPEGKEVIDIGLRTDEQVKELIHIMGNFAIRTMGNKIYKLPGGEYCGQSGWDFFQEEFKKQGKL